MGCYVNPKGVSKEEWLQKNATVVYAPGKLPSWETIFSSKELPVVWMDNGPFTAAGIAYNEREYKEFTDPTDPRPKQVFKVEIAKLEEVSPLKDYLTN